MAEPTRNAAAGRFQSDGEDFFQFVDRSGNILSWIDGRGFPQGGLKAVAPLSGLLADIPLDLAPGVLYFATDTSQLYVFTGPDSIRVVALPLFGNLSDIPLLNTAQLYFATDTNQLYIGSPSGNRLISGSLSAIDCGTF